MWYMHMHGWAQRVVYGVICSSCRRVLLALQQPAWSQANHHNFPPAFQTAACTFLLAAATSAQRCQQEREVQLALGLKQGGCCLGDLPPLMLERVLGLAAYPLSAWL